MKTFNAVMIIILFILCSIQNILITKQFKLINEGFKEQIILNKTQVRFNEAIMSSAKKRIDKQLEFNDVIIERLSQL